MKEKQSIHFSPQRLSWMSYSCKYLVDSRFKIFDESMDEIKKIKVFFSALLLGLMR